MSRHCAAAQIDDPDDVVVASVNSLARDPAALGRLLEDPKNFWGVDEAHHGSAATYRKILNPLRKRPRRNLLGLSATPTRTIPRERPVLAGLFGNRVLFEAHAAELVERGILARPILVRVETREPLDGELTPSDRATPERIGDFGGAFLGRIARRERRNMAVIDHFLKFRHRYGKTLIFAIDVEHAAVLADRLRSAGIAADYVAGARRDGRDNGAILRRFRDPAGDLDVLVSVLLLGEGVDLPAVQAVLLTRPTASVIRFGQMAGRALRGPAVGGTGTAYMITFRDDWQQLPRMEAELDRMFESAGLSDMARAGGTAGSGQSSPPEGVSTSTESAAAVAAEVRGLIADEPTDSAESVAERWYVLGGPGGPRLVAVYSHQRAGWEAAIAHLERLPTAALADVRVARLKDLCDSAGEPPPPSERALGQLLEHFRGGGGRPTGYGQEGRRASDPRTLARRIKADDLGEAARCALLEEHYTPLARAVYPTRRHFHVAVEEALHALRYPEEAAWASPAAPVFEPQSGRSSP